MEGRYIVNVLKWRAPDHFWAREVPSENMSREAHCLEQLMEDLRMYAENDTIPAPRVNHAQKGKDYIGKCKDTKWYRVRIRDILQTRNGHQANCLKLDYGTTNHMIQLQHLREMPQKYGPDHLVYQAKECRLAGIQPISMRQIISDETGDVITRYMPADQWDASATKRINYLMAHCVSVPSLEPCYYDDRGVCYARLYLDSPKLGAYCLNELLVQEEYAMNTENLQALSPDSSHDPDKPTKTRRRNKGQKGLDAFLNPQGLDIPPSEPLMTATDEAGSSPYNSCTESDRDSRVSMGSNPSVYSKSSGMTTPLREEVGATAAGLPRMDSVPPLGRGLGRGMALLNIKPSISSSQESLGSASTVGASSVQSSRTVTPLESVPTLPSTQVANSQTSPGLAVPGIGRGQSALDAYYGRGLRQSSLSPGSSVGSRNTSPQPSIGRGAKINAAMKSVNLETLTSSESEITSPLVGQGRGCPTSSGSSTSTPLGRGHKLLSGGEMSSDSSQAGRHFDPSQFNTNSRETHHVDEQNAHMFSSSGEESPRKTPKAKKKNVSFSDHEEFFSIPPRRSGPDPPPPSEPFTPNVLMDHVELRGFAAAGNNEACLRFSGNKSFQTPDPTPEEYGVQVHCIGKPKFELDIRKIDFSAQVQSALHVFNVRRATTLQMYSWPALLRGLDLVAVGARGAGRQAAGKTTTYLASLLSELSHSDTYQGLPISSGPIVLIVAPTTHYVQRIKEQIDNMQNIGSDTGRRDKYRTIAIYAGALEGDLEIDLLNGCQILVATPHSLLRMLDKKVTCLDRLAHLVLEESEKLLEDFGEQVTSILALYQQASEARDGDPEPPKQVIAMASQWTPQLRQFAECFMQNPTVVISTKQECAFAGGVHQVALMMMSDARLSHILTQLSDDTTRLQHKILVCVDEPQSAINIHKYLQDYGIISLCVHHNMVDMELDEIYRQWKLRHRPDSRPILVTTDQALDATKLQDVTCVIHYDIPEQKRTFEDRLWCMRKAWRKPFEAADPDHPGCLSFLYMTEAQENMSANVIKLLRRCDVEIPPELQLRADKHQERKERDTRNRLCANLKAFGHCKHEHRCKYRHKVMHSLDYPGQNPKYLTVPMEGQIKIRVTHVENATNYYARLMSHTDLEDRTTDLSLGFTSLSLDMSLYFNKPINRRVTDLPEVNKLYAWENTQHIFNRVEVLQLRDSDNRGYGAKAVVYMVDSGDIREVDTIELLEIPDELRDVKYQAVEIYLCRIIPKDQDTAWPVGVSTNIAEHIQNKELEGFIALSLGHTVWLESLQYRRRLDNLQTTVTMFTVRHLLLNDRMAVENPTHLEELYAACKDRVDIPSSHDPTRSTTRAYTVHGKMSHPKVSELPVGEYIDVSIEATDSPNLFFVQNYGLREKIQTFQDDIVDYVRSNELETPSRLQTATLVLAEIPGSYGWYRGKILMDKGGGMYDVFFVDTGDTVEVDRTAILPLPSRFQAMQFFAMECCLVNVEPIGDDWPDEVGDWLYDVTRSSNEFDVYGKKMVAKVMRRAPAKHTGRYRYGLEMFDTRLEYDVNLGHQLVLDGHAQLSSTAVQEMFAHVPEAEPGTAVAEIIQSCKAILQSKESMKRMIQAAKIKKTVEENISSPGPLLEAGIPSALCTVLQLTRQAAVVELVITAYVHLVLTRSGEQPLTQQEMLAIGSLCWTLDTVTDVGVIKSILTAFKGLMSEKRYRSSMIEQGAFRVIGQILDKITEQPEIELLAASILDKLLGDVTSKEDVSLVVQSRCLQALSACVARRPSSDTVVACLHVMEALAPRMRENIRKAGGVLAICSHLDDFTGAQVREQVIHTLKALANNNRFNKDVMNEQKAATTLQRYVTDASLSDEVRSTALELAQRLRQLLPSNKSPAKKQAGHGAGIVNGATEVEGIRPIGGDVIRNRPLPPKFCSSTVPIKSAKPQVKWAQDRWNMWLTVEVKDVPRDAKVATFTEDTVTFRAVSESTEYYFELHLYEVITPGRCESCVSPGAVRLGLRKKSPGQWLRLCKDRHKLSYVTRDYEKYVYLTSEDEDEDIEDQQEEEPKEGPLEMARRTYTTSSGLPALTSGVTPSASSSARRREAPGLPAELVMGDTSSGDDDGSDDSLVGEYVNQDPNKKYDYFRL